MNDRVYTYVKRITVPKDTPAAEVDAEVNRQVTTFVRALTNWNHRSSLRLQFIREGVYELYYSTPQAFEG